MSFLWWQGKCGTVSQNFQKLAKGDKGSFRREIITVRGQSYVSRLPKYWPPPPSPPSEWVLTKAGGTNSPGGEGGGGSIFWKTRDIGLPSYSNNLSTVLSVYSTIHQYIRQLVGILSMLNYLWLRKSMKPYAYLDFIKDMDSNWPDIIKLITTVLSLLLFLDSIRSQH